MKFEDEMVRRIKRLDALYLKAMRSCKPEDDRRYERALAEVDRRLPIQSGSLDAVARSVPALTALPRAS